MSRFIFVALLAIALMPVASWAANPHFPVCLISTDAIGNPVITGQIAGLGNRKKPAPGTSLLLTATATALCVDATSTPPVVIGSGVPVSKSVLYPPKNGNQVFSITIDTPFVLPCASPATIVFANVQVVDLTPGDGLPRCPEPDLPEFPDDE